MKDLDTDALVVVQRQLGYPGVGSPHTVFKDGELVQTFDTTGAIRRSRSDIAGGGTFFAIMRNDHAGADEETSTIDPLLPGALATETFPAQVDTSRFDLWILGCSFNRFSGTGTNPNAFLEIDMSVTDRLRAFGVDDMGASAGFGGTLTLAFINDLQVVGSVARCINTLSGQTWFPIGLRMPAQGSILRFHSIEADAAATVYDCIILLGLFPVGMGQDLSA